MTNPTNTTDEIERKWTADENGWLPMEAATDDDVWGFTPKCDLWMAWGASPMTMGIADAFRVPDCWRDDEGAWWHMHHGERAELTKHYIRAWRPLPKPPMVAHPQTEQQEGR